jgi:hypothetical protein
MEEFQFEQRADFSAIVGNSKIVSSSVGPGDEAVLLTVAPEYEKAPFDRETGTGRAKRHYPATFIRMDGNKVKQVVELSEVEIAFPFVQPLPSGEVLLVGARCHCRDGNPEKNSVVCSPDGEVRARFVLGDGINDVQTTIGGRIWVSYFDGVCLETTAGTNRWERPD